MKRTATRRFAAALLLLCVASRGTPAFAQPAGANAPLKDPTPAEAEEAKRHFKLGLELFKQQVYDAALAEFEQSYALGHRYTALRNVAQCHRELKQFAEAYDAIELLLSRHGAQLKDTEKAEFQQALVDLQEFIAQLSLTVNVPDATIVVDSKEVGTSPLNRKLRLNVGAHTIRATKSGYDPAELTITLLVKQDAAETLTLKATAAAPAAATGAARAVAHLRVKATPGNADILLDGERVTAGKYEGDVTEGDHALDVSAQGFVSMHRTLRVSAGQQDVENVALDPFVPEKPPEKSLLGRLYGSLDLAVLRHINGYEPLLVACGDQEVQCNQPQYPGGAAIMHVGFTFDWLSAELVGGFGIDLRSESMTATGPAAPAGSLVLAAGNAQRNEAMSAQGFSGFLGLGIRATSQDKLVRVTVGAAPGLSLRHYTLTRTLTDGVDASYTDEGTSAAVGVMTDVALLIGTSPGPKLRVGLALWMDFPQGNVLSAGGAPLSATATPTGGTGAQVQVERPAFTLQSGSQFLIGPTLGVQFGK
jgi:tetratricopeptide (TPR) repeat protein